MKLSFLKSVTGLALALSLVAAASVHSADLKAPKSGKTGISTKPLVSMSVVDAKKCPSRTDENGGNSTGPGNHVGAMCHYDLKAGSCDKYGADCEDFTEENGDRKCRCDTKILGGGSSIGSTGQTLGSGNQAALKQRRTLF